MTSQPEQQQLQYCPISKEVNNQLMKFGQSIEYNISLKTYIKCDGECISSISKSKSKCRNRCRNSYGENSFGLSLSPETETPSTGVEVNRQMLKGVKGCVVKLDNVIVL